VSPIATESLHLALYAIQHVGRHSGYRLALAQFLGLGLK
jgi:hypothetical protein